jgi:ribosomal 30S subunit maturation factor RimM
MNQTDETDVCDVKEDQLNDKTVENNSKWITVDYKKKKKNTKIYRTNKINQRNKN